MKWTEFTFGGEKYLISSLKEYQTYDGAKRECKDRGGFLARDLSPTWFDVAAKERGFKLLQNYYVGAKLRGSDMKNDYEWNSGNDLPATHPKWMRGFPTVTNPRIQKYDCVEIRKAKNWGKNVMEMRNDSCGMRQGFVCQLKSA